MLYYVIVDYSITGYYNYCTSLSYDIIAYHIILYNIIYYAIMSYSVCIYIYIYIYTHVCVYISLYICIYIYIYIHTHTHSYTRCIGCYSAFFQRTLDTAPCNRGRNQLAGTNDSNKCFEHGLT